MPSSDIYKVQIVNAAGAILATIPISNAALAFDTTDRQRISLYGKASAAGDTPVLLSSAGRIVTTIAVAHADGVSNTNNSPDDGSGNGRPMPIFEFNYNGASWDRRRTPIKFIDVNAVAVGTIANVWTPTSGKKFRLMGGCISVSAAVSVLFEDNAAGAGNFIFRVPKMPVDTPFQFTVGGNGLLSAAANNVLKATSSAAANLTGTLFGTEE